MKDFDSIYAKFKKDLIEVMEIKDASSIQPEALVVELGLDSLKAAALCALLEFDYDVIIPIEVFARRVSVRDMVNWVCDPDSIAKALEAPMLDPLA
jgi:acyl carrier protein